MMVYLSRSAKSRLTDNIVLAMVVIILLLLLPSPSFQYGVARTCANFERTDLLNVTDFYELSVNNAYVDKSLLIEELLTAGDSNFGRSSSSRIIRPRGWGKTTNFDMLKRFFDIEIDGSGRPLPKSKCRNHKLFSGGNINVTVFANGTVDTRHVKSLEIRRYKDHMKRLGKYPVVYASFKYLVGRAYREVESNAKKLVANLFEQRSYLTDDLDDADRIDYDLYRNGNNVSGSELLDEAIPFLCRLLSERFLRNVYLFIDDYDEPIVNMFVHLVAKYRSEQIKNEKDLLRRVAKSVDFTNTVTLVSNILNAALRHNGALEYGLISGVYDVELRPTKTSGSSTSLSEVVNENDLTTGEEAVYTMLDDKYFSFYGFTETEVTYLLKRLSYRTNTNRVKQWYGYDICRTTLYNPWSVRHFIAYKGDFRYYWRMNEIANINNNINNKQKKNTTTSLVVNLADTALSMDGMQSTLQNLVVSRRFRNYRSSKLRLDERLLDDLNVLLYAGYLTGNDFGAGDTQDDLRLPNIEIRDQMLRKVFAWTCRKLRCKMDAFDRLAKQLTKFRTDDFENGFKQLLLETAAADQNEDTASSSILYYNGVMITLMDRLERGNGVAEYSIESNSRFDYHRGDVMLLFKSTDGTRLIVVKYKMMTGKDERLDQEVNEGLKIIKNLLIVDKYEYAKIRKILIVILMVKGKQYRLRQEVVINDDDDDDDDDEDNDRVTYN